MKLDNPELSEHGWLADAVAVGLRELHVTELASFPIEAHDGSLERLMVATDLGIVEGTISGPPVDGFPGLILDLRLWRDCKVSARARVDAQHGAHDARASLMVNDRTVSSWSLRTRDAANEFIAVVLAEAGRTR
jgi:hypothetical protein